MKTSGTTGPASAPGMMPTSNKLHQAWFNKTAPPVEQVRSDVWSIPVPIPDNPLRYTLSYLFIGPETLLIDPGWDSDLGWQALNLGLAQAGIEPRSIAGIVITHAHADHHGMTHRLTDSIDAWVGMHPKDSESLAAERLSGPEFRSAQIDWFSMLGAPVDFAESSVALITAAMAHTVVAQPDVLVEDGTILAVKGRRIKAIWTPGHTPGHLSFYEQDADLIVTGDHVLPRISPNIGLQPTTAEPPLGHYLRSLDKLRPYESAEVLPAHEWRFRGLNERIDQLQLHHRRRFDEAIGLLRDGPLTAWQVAEKLTWSRGWDQVQGFMRRAALAETLAHLDHLVQTGELTRTTGTPALFAANN